MPEESEDEDTLFCRSLIPRLKRMPPQSKFYQTDFAEARPQPNFHKNSYRHQSADFQYAHSVNRQENASTS